MFFSIIIKIMWQVKSNFYLQNDKDKIKEK